MAIFEYLASDPQGTIVRGQVTSTDEPAARAMLESRGLTVTDLSLRAAGDEAGILGNEEIAAFVEAVGGAGASRLPIEITLAALAEETKDRPLANVAQQIGAQLEQGATIEQVIASLGHKLPHDLARLLQAGVDSGDLAGMMERLAQERMTAQRVQRRIHMALAYPLLVAVILIPLLAFLSLYVVPMFAQMFLDFDLALPTVTQLILQTSRQIPFLLGGIAIFLLIIPIVFRIVGGRWLFHRVRSALPLVGPIWTWSGQREFAAQLAPLIRLRMPMAEAVSYAGDAISDRNVGWACRRVAKRLESGQSLGDCLNQSIHFDRSLVALIIWGERYGLLPDALRVATSVFDDQIEQYTTLLRRLLPPVALVAVAALIFFIIVGLMVPLVTLIEGLSK
jgi:type II secretory pathway component PulF